MSKEYLILWDDYVFYKDGRIYSKYWKKFLIPCVNNYGYVRIKLKCNDGKRRMFYWHRVIYTYFNGAIPEGYEVNHIDENKQNNALSNLNLMTPKENINYGTCIERRAVKQINHPNKSKAVEALDKDGNVVKRYASMREAERNGFRNSNVSKCCMGLRRTCGGYAWRYA